MSHFDNSSKNNFSCSKIFEASNLWTKTQWNFRYWNDLKFDRQNSVKVQVCVACVTKLWFFNWARVGKSSKQILHFISCITFDLVSSCDPNWLEFKTGRIDLRWFKMLFCLGLVWILQCSRKLLLFRKVLLQISHFVDSTLNLLALKCKFSCSKTFGGQRPKNCSQFSFQYS